MARANFLAPRSIGSCRVAGLDESFPIDWASSKDAYVRGHVHRRLKELSKAHFVVLTPTYRFRTFLLADFSSRRCRRTGRAVEHDTDGFRRFPNLPAQSRRYGDR